MRKLVIGVVAIVTFTAAAIVGVWLLTRSGPAGGPLADVVAPQEPAPAPLPMPVPVPANLGPLAPSEPSPPPVYGPPPPEPPRDSWEAVPVSARPAALGPAGGAIGRGLIELQSRLAACFDEDTAARHGMQPHTVGKDATGSGGTTPVLVLHIETTPGRARIVDAPVDNQGSASDGVIACAQSVLRGQSFVAPGAQAGGRYRLTQPLIP